MVPLPLVLLIKFKELVSILWLRSDNLCESFAIIVSGGMEFSTPKIMMRGDIDGVQAKGFNPHFFKNGFLIESYIW